MDLARLNQQFEAIPGHHDYGAFTRAEYRDEPTIRYVDQAKFRYLTDPISGSTDELVGFRIRGNAFLHNMIRILVGTALDLTRGKILDDPGAILASKDRLRAGRTAPAHGLYLRAAYYRSIAGVHCLRYLDDFPDFRQNGPNSATRRDAKQPETPSGEP
jgi:tRNA pseudouridine38-40 synthase